MSKDFRPLKWEEYFIYSAEYLPLAAGTGTAFTDFEIRIARDADFKIYGITYIATDARIFMRLKDNSFGRNLEKGDLDMRAIAGRPISGDFAMLGQVYNDFIPYLWSVPYRLSGGATMTVQCADFANVSNNVRISFHGAKVRNSPAPWLRPYKYRIPFTYELDMGAIGANASLVQVMSLDTDSDFLVQKLTGVRTGPCTLLIGEGSRGRDWMDRSVHFDNLVGRSMFPNNLLEKTPRFLQRGSTLSANVTDTSGASNTVRLYFHGIKLYG